MHTLAHILNETRSVQCLLHADTRVMLVAKLVSPALSDQLHVLSTFYDDVWTVIHSLICELKVSFIVVPSMT